MMSRLRHPNIVLVMGISLVDQDLKSWQANQLSTKRTANPVWNSDEDITGGRYMGAASTPGPVKSLPQTICIITEYLEQGSLADILYGPRRLPADVWTYDLILTCAIQAARGMLYLHSHSPPICHRDLKSSNLVVDDHWVVKVTDFGMSRIVPEKVQDIQKGITKDDGPISEALRESAYTSFVASPIADPSSINDSTSGSSTLRASIRATEGRGSVYNLEMTSNLGTTAWCAPELLTSASTTRYSVKVDVYSFGMVLWELWEKRKPFEEYSSRFDIIDAIRAGSRPKIGDDCPPVFRSLIQRCWQADPARRPTFQSIVKYLRDEHAMIRRQRTATPSYNSRTDSYVGSSISSSAQTAEPTDNKGILRNFPFSSPFGSTSYGPEGESGRPSSGGSSPNSSRNSFWPNSSRSRSYSDRTSTTLPAGRSPLVVSAVDGNLQQLAMTPVNTSSSAISPIQHQRKTEYAPPSLTATAPTRVNPNAWREKYVLRLTGWTSAQPDTGLPPSLVHQSSTTMSSSQARPIPLSSSGYGTRTALPESSSIAMQQLHALPVDFQGEDSRVPSDEVEGKSRENTSSDDSISNPIHTTSQPIAIPGADSSIDDASIQ